MEVFLGENFKLKMQRFPEDDITKIREFIYYVKSNGLGGLPGRNKSSDNVPTDDPNWREKVQYAQQHRLWHYHIGIPRYTGGSYGDKTSEYVLHYTRNENSIKIVEMWHHPPLELPSKDYLT